MTHHQILHKSPERKQSKGVTNQKIQTHATWKRISTNFIKKKKITIVLNAKMVIAFLQHHQAITTSSQPDPAVSWGEPKLTGLSLLLSHKTLIFLFNSTTIPSQEVLCCSRTATCDNSATSVYNQVKTIHI